MPHGFGSLLFLADVIRSDLRDTDNSRVLQDDNELERHIRKCLKGGRIMLPSDGPAPRQRLMRDFSEWIKRNKWSVGIMVLYTLFCGGVWVVLLFPPFGYIYFAAVLSWPFVLFALIVGSTKASKGVLILGGVVLGLLLAIAAYSPAIRR